MIPAPIQLRDLWPLAPDHLDAAGWGWLYREAGAGYVAPEAVRVREEDADALAEAADVLYDLLVETLNDVIAADRLAALGLPERIHRLVRHTWEDDRHWHVLSRFDLSGGLDATAPKLLELNADTPTMLPETSIVQWALLKANRLDEAAQFNLVYERLVDALRHWRGLWPDHAPHLAAVYAAASDEDAANAQVVAEAAREAGFTVAHALPIDALTVSPGEGVFVEHDGAWTRLDFVYKFVPWEWIVDDEPELFGLLEALILDDLVTVANPPYALALQSKALLADAWERMPGHPYLLEAHRTPFASPEGTVEKVILGREGANVRIIAPDGQVLADVDGTYADQPRIWQAYHPLPQDAQGRSYQAGVFFSGEASGLGIRRGSLVLDNGAEFVAHLVE
ncbi:MAG: glutathionylspermidine synthase family protein [Rhodothermales bacterium]|nr:glutathionylspermidine synthase family protein [Rhodothermales bacterium]